MNILYIQYAGDFAEAYDRLYRKKGKENYYGQKYSVDAVVKQARDNYKVLVLVLKTDGYRVELEKNLTTVGLNKGKTDYALIKHEIKKFRPDRVILRMPDVTILRFLRKQLIPTLPVFADSFEFSGWIRGRLYRYLLSRELTDKSIQWVANHQINSAISIKNLGIDSRKILPYDWEHSDNPKNWKKSIPSNLETKELIVFYAGCISEMKGVLDLVEAVKYVIEAKRKIKVKFAGKGNIENVDIFAKSIGVRESIEFLGLLDHDEVLCQMNLADVVIVPSHHAYPEGLPMTIMESLMVHTPVIASDHPMFLGRVGNRGAVLFFQEKNSRNLAEEIILLCSDIKTYHKLCVSAPLEWNDLVLDLKWADMINSWLSNPNFNFIKNSLFNYKGV